MPLERLGDLATISVVGHGIGIAPQDRDRLFQRFHRASDAGGQAGLGLGLYITRLIAEAHGGHVSLDGALGKGSTFFLTLPLAVEATMPV